MVEKEKERMRGCVGERCWCWGVVAGGGGEGVCGEIEASSIIKDWRRWIGRTTDSIEIQASGGG